MWMTIQVAPDDCTGCGVCVDVCPAKSKEVVKHKSIDMMPKDEHLEDERDELRLLPRHPARRSARRSRSRRSRARRCSSRCSSSPGRARGCGETPYLKAPVADVRRPDPRRERDRVLVDLRRQPADDALVAGRQRPRSRLVELAVRGQRRVRPRDAAGARPSGRVRADAAGAARARRSARTSPARSSTHPRTTRRSSPSSASASRRSRRLLEARDDDDVPEPAGRGRRAGAQERVDRRGRRLGLRHRLRRARPRARERTRRERARARHAGLLEHRRAGLQGDAARRRREVRRGRQGRSAARTSG